MNFRKPGKRSFYKYASPDTVLAILESKRVRYSSPLKFNDPFDLQSGLHFEFELSTLFEAILDKLGEIASAPIGPQIDESQPMAQVIKLVRDHYPTHGFPRDRFSEMSGDLFRTTIELIGITRQKYQEKWWNDYLPGLRVFCVSEERDNLLMWAHYAKEHTGAVLEFLSLPEEDNALSVAESILYVDKPPPFFSKNEWVDEVLAINKIDINGFYKRYAYYKSDKWAYEREWRVWYPTIPSPKELFEDIPIRQSEFASLYIGCKADKRFTEKVLALTRSSFPKARVFQAIKREDIYTLEYKEINSN